MRLPAFNYSRQRWDRFQEFHHNPLGNSEYSLFTQFCTGLLRVNYLPKPNERGVYNTLGLRLVKVEDSGLPELYTPEGVRVLPAHIKHHYLVIDQDTNQVTRLAYKYRQEHHLSMRNSYALFLGGKPFDAVPIEVDILDTQWKKGHWEHLNTLRYGCRMKEQLDPKLLRVNTKKYNTRPVPAQDMVHIKNISELTTDQLLHISRYGYTWPRKIVEYPYLLAEPNKT